MTTMEILTLNTVEWLATNRQPNKKYRVHPYSAFGIVTVEIKQGRYWYVVQTFAPA